MELHIGFAANCNTVFD